MQQILKRIKVQWGILLSLAIALAACSETTVPKKEDLSRYPQFAPFVLEMTEFQGVAHQIDTGDYSFRYKTRIQDPQAFFQRVDRAAKNQGWTIRSQAQGKREYYKVGVSYPASKDIVELTYAPSDACVTFRAHPLG